MWHLDRYMDEVFISTFDPFFTGCVGFWKCGEGCALPCVYLYVCPLCFTCAGNVYIVYTRASNSSQVAYAVNLLLVSQV